MQRTFIYFAAFTGMASVFAATLLVVALVLGGPDRAEPAANAADGTRTGGGVHRHCVRPRLRAGDGPRRRAGNLHRHLRE